MGCTHGDFSPPDLTLVVSSFQLKGKVMEKACGVNTSCAGQPPRFCESCVTWGVCIGTDSAWFNGCLCLCFTGFYLKVVWLGAASPETSPAPSDVLFLILPSFSVLCFNLCNIPFFLMALGIWPCMSGGLDSVKVTCVFFRANSFEEWSFSLVNSFCKGKSST